MATLLIPDCASAQTSEPCETGMLLPLLDMATTFHGPDPWSHITRAIGTRGARYAAIAYLGHDAPELLPLRAGDLLVVNASRAAIRAHATSPVVLAHYLDKGVRILSSPTLHAKVITTNRRAVIGSANASANSVYSEDAAVITDDPQIVADARNFIDAITEVTEVNSTFIENALLEWEIGRAVPVPGVSGRINNPESDFLPTPVTRMFIKHIVDDHSNLSDEAKLESRQPQKRTSAGPTVKYQLQSLRLDKPNNIKRDDVIVLISSDNEWIHAPAVVTSESIQFPQSGGAILHLRTRTDLPPIFLVDAEKALTDSGHPTSRLQKDHYVRSPTLRAAVLDLWNLQSPRVSG